MDYATTDLVFAIAHNFLVFALAGILAYEIAIIRVGMTARDTARIVHVDAGYGALAALIILVGFSRAYFSAKGWDYYSANHFFWGKISAFALMGLLSAIPTIAIFRWGKALKADPAGTPRPASIRNVRRVLLAELVLLGCIIAFAAAMARGYGMPNMNA